jgi:predicted thioesterase
MEQIIGVCGQATASVTENQTAQAVGSGSLPVFATPMLAALVERAAWTSIQPYLEDGQGSVGTQLALSHEAATPVGMEVTATTTVTEVDGRRIVFSFVVEDPCGVIGRGTHERFVIWNDKFLSKCQKKLEQI